MFRGRGLLLLLVASALHVHAQFQVPEVTFQALTPKGLRVIMPALAGMKLFGFHGKVSSKIDSKESGTIDGDITEINSGRFMFEDKNIVLVPGDTIHYWLFVQYENLGYRKDSQLYQVTRLVSADTPAPTVTPVETTTKSPTNCVPTVTKVRGRQQVCKGQLVFEETFSNRLIDTSKWIIEKRLPSNQQEYEFVSYQEKPISIVGNSLNIVPYLQENEPGFDPDTMATGKLDLTYQCSAHSNELCIHDAIQRREPIPPIISGKISTKNSFNFKYGKIEIRAKLPQGDWLFPELYLEPSLSKYGSMGYDSGIMRIAFSRGNLNLQTSTELFGNNVLYGGVILNQFEPCRSETVRKHNNIDVAWGNDYHIYGLIWKEGSIHLTVDGKEFGIVYAPTDGFKKYDESCRQISNVNWKYGGPFAPFDEEFYISLGLGAAGVSDFPDGLEKKKWKNKSSKNRKLFSEDKNNWYNTWNPANSRLIVDYVKVWAL